MPKLYKTMSSLMNAIENEEVVAGERFYLLAEVPRIVGIDVPMDDDNKSLWDDRAERENRTPLQRKTFTVDPYKTVAGHNVSVRTPIEMTRTGLVKVGRRRVLYTRDANKTGKFCIPAMLTETDNDLSEVVLENTARKDYNWMQRVRMVARLKADSGLSNAKIGERFGVSGTQVGTWLKFSDCTKALEAALEDDLISPTEAAKEQTVYDGEGKLVMTVVPLKASEEELKKFFKFYSKPKMGPPKGPKNGASTQNKKKGGLYCPKGADFEQMLCALEGFGIWGELNPDHDDAKVAARHANALEVIEAFRKAWAPACYSLMRWARGQKDWTDLVDLAKAAYAEDASQVIAASKALVKLTSAKNASKFVADLAPAKADDNPEEEAPAAAE